MRCDWAVTDLMKEYHDFEWGTPLHDDRVLFEFLILEGAQAGLTWATILQRREGYRKAFDDFDPAIVAAYDQTKIESLLHNEKIIRNRRKIESAVNNARVFLAIQDRFGSFDKYLWRFSNGQPIQNSWTNVRQLPPSTPLSESLSNDLKKLGMQFCGPTICYAFMQATGVVNDHIVSCFRYKELNPEKGNI